MARCWGMAWYLFGRLIDGQQRSNAERNKDKTGGGPGPTREDSVNDEGETDDPNNPGTAYSEKHPGRADVV